jgi:hypothetical protein
MTIFLILIFRVIKTRRRKKRKRRKKKSKPDLGTKTEKYDKKSESPKNFTPKFFSHLLKKKYFFSAATFF